MSCHWLHVTALGVSHVGPTLAAVAAVVTSSAWTVKTLKSSRDMAASAITAAADREHDRWVHDQRAELYLDILNEAARLNREFHRKYNPGMAAAEPLGGTVDEAKLTDFNNRAIVYASDRVTEAFVVFHNELAACAVAADNHDNVRHQPTLDAFWAGVEKRVVDAIEALGAVIRDELRVVRES
ncbi:MAG TPA: hypothetical protein VHV82_08205 [Sporichthyaceae bacterium]|nr:hypothetical protein [Sporichthyaceae bacterium]